MNRQTGKEVTMDSNTRKTILERGQDLLVAIAAAARRIGAGEGDVRDEANALAGGREDNTRNDVAARVVCGCAQVCRKVPGLATHGGRCGRLVRRRSGVDQHLECDFSMRIRGSLRSTGGATRWR